MINQYAYIKTNKNNRNFKDNVLRYKPFNFRKDNCLRLTEPKRQKNNNHLETTAQKTKKHYKKIKMLFNVLATEKNHNIIRKGANLNYIKINSKLTPLTYNLIEVTPINKFETDLINQLEPNTII